MGRVLADLRSALRLCEERGELLTVDREISPDCEIASLTKALDGGPALVFQRPRGYEGWKVVTNLLSRRERAASFFGTESRKLPTRLIEAVKNPIAPQMVETGPCQQNVLTNDIDILKTLPIINQTRRDVGPVISGGIVMVELPEELAEGKQAFNLSFHRLNPGLGKDWMSLCTLFNRHFLEVLHYHRSKRTEFPVTINIGVSPAIAVCSSGGSLLQLSPFGRDELAVAGNLQGAPVEICRAKTVDAYSIANAEVVIEGVVRYDEHVFEHPTAKEENVKFTNDNYFFPEFMGYMGKPSSAFKFEVTAITYRNDPLLYCPLADSLESGHLATLLTEASIYNACHNVSPKVFVNCHVPDGMRGLLGAVIQCKVQHPLQQGLSQNLISAAFGAAKDLQWVIAVDEDVDIYDPSDLLWALTLRTRPVDDINVIKGAGLDMASRLGGNVVATAKWSVDTTVSVSDKWRFVRPRFEPIDLSRWLGDDEIAKGLALMNEGARSIARRGV